MRNYTTKISILGWMPLLIAILMLTIGMKHANADTKGHHKGMPVGRWREIKRFDKDSDQVPFMDTMFITFKKNDSFSYHNKDAFIYNGIYILDGKDLDFGYAKFVMTYKKTTSMVLHDAKGYYLFGIDSSDTLKTIILPKEEKIDSDITIEKMIGHWSSYKRTAKGELPNLDHNTMIKSLLITGPSSGGKLGFVFADNDKRDDPSWSITKLNKDLTLDCEGKSKRTLKIIKCQGGELIIEDESIRYFFKQFK